LAPTLRKLDWLAGVRGFELTHSGSNRVSARTIGKIGNSVSAAMPTGGILICLPKGAAAKQSESPTMEWGNNGGTAAETNLAN
jgi:hypothetical protein